MRYFLIEDLNGANYMKIKVENGGGYRDRTGDLLIAKNIEEQPEQHQEEPSAGKPDGNAPADGGPE
ncbi:MAG: hypothetical protein HY207_09390 [Nitrospirae bacterium]|nr:hypothetical protein [Nitrospirota bacterium]